LGGPTIWPKNGPAGNIGTIIGTNACHDDLDQFEIDGNTVDLDIEQETYITYNKGATGSDDYTAKSNLKLKQKTWIH